jgi:uncharacterized membrane protein YciS (DUF1049 family)
MRFLKILLLALLVLALAWFAAQNWVPVTVKLWAPYELVIRLPVLLALAVLLGWLPGAIAHSVSRWSLTRRLTRTERELEARRAAEAAAVAPPATNDLPPPQAQPIVVPPAGA